jgi:hypothetical protein
MNTPNLEPLIQRYNQAAAAQEELVERLRGTGQGTAEQRNTQMVEAARNTNQAAQAIQAALPPGQTLASVIGGSPPGAAPAQPAPPGSNVLPASSATGTNRYLQRVLEAHRLGNLNLNVQDNLLNEFDRYTYKFGLYLVNDRDSELVDIGTRVFDNQVRKFTVAESGVTTGFNIVDVEIIDAVSSSHRNRNNVTSDINITITEPYGLTLVDRVFLASQELGVLNWRMAPLILTLEMRMISSTGVPVSDNALIRKAYKLVISDMNSQLTEVGSTYKITAAVSNAMGFRDQFYMLPMNLTINVGNQTESRAPTISMEVPARPATGSSGQSPTSPPRVDRFTQTVGTVGQFFHELGIFMTSFYREARNQGVTTQSVPFVEYEFQVATDLASEKLNFATNNSTNARNNGFARQGEEIHVSRIGISELVDDIMASLDDVNFLVPPDKPGIVRIPRVECRVEHVGWDGILNDYIRKFTYFISVADTVRPVPNPQTGFNFQEGPRATERQTQRITDLNQRKVIQKAYPYYYTGMNTEILSLDITFNQLHIIPLPLHNGETVTPADEGQNLQQRIRELVTRRQQAAEQIDRSRSALPRLDAQVAQLSAALDSSQLQRGDVSVITDPELRSAIREDIDQISGRARNLAQAPSASSIARQAVQGRIALLNTERSQLPTSIGQLETQIARFDSDISEIRNQNVYLFPGESGTPRVTIPGVGNNEANPRVQALIEQRNAQARRNETLRADRGFVEDININDTVAQMGRLVYMANHQDILNNMARPSTVSDPRQSPVRPTYSTILAQMYDRVGLQLTEIEMEIRGDPFWLGETNLERLEELARFTSTGVSTSGTFASTISDRDARYANYYGQDAGFLLLFRAGNQPSETTGYMNFDLGSRENQSVFFNGVYLAIEVTHVFSNGKFTQKIRAQRDNLIDLNRVGSTTSASATQGATGAATPVAAAPTPRPATNGNAPAAGGAPAPAPAGGAPAPAPAAGSSSQVVTNLAAVPTTTPAQPPSAEPSPQPVVRAFITPTPQPGESAAQFGARLGAAIRQQREGGGAPALPLTQSE